MPIKIDFLRKEYLGDVVSLLSVQYKSLREKLPVLPAAYENIETLTGLLNKLTENPNGIVALRNAKLVGFLAGLEIAEFLGKRAMYCPVWANATEPGDSRRIYEEMYTHISRHWIDQGDVIHAVSILSHDQPGNEAWKWLGFGLSAVDGIREIEALERAGIESMARDLIVRQASLGELEEVIAMDRALARHLSQAPTFWIHDVQDYEEWMKIPGNVAWLAYREGETVGFMALEPGENCECAFLRDKKTVNIAGAFTKENERGRGIASTILNQALDWAEKEGYERCAVDFEAMNVLATRFWMHYFKPVSYSWIRWIDERLRS